MVVRHRPEVSVVWVMGPEYIYKTGKKHIAVIIWGTVPKVLWSRNSHMGGSIINADTCITVNCLGVSENGVPSPTLVRK